MSYRLVYRGLSRRLRKIVRNRYKFRRQLLCLQPASRIRAGVRTYVFMLQFTPGRSLQTRLIAVCAAEGLAQQLQQGQQLYVLRLLRQQHFLF
jgi:hypothetical protein